LDEVIYNWNGTNYSLFDDGLVLMMNFDNVSALGENDSLVVDVSGNGNNGTCSGTNCSIWKTNGKYGGAFEFDGVDDYVSVDDSSSLDIVNELTMGLWVKVNNLSFSDQWIDLIIKPHTSYAAPWIMYDLAIESDSTVDFQLNINGQIIGKHIICLDCIFSIKMKEKQCRHLRNL